MSDLIRKRDAVSAISELLMILDGKTPTWNEVYHAIEDIPSAETERKKGTWVDGMPYVNSHWKVCSECHVSAPDSCGGFNFCPNCGADMRGE